MGRGPRGLVSPIFRQTEGRKPRNLSSLPHRNGWHYRACRGGQFSPPRIGIYTSSSADSKLARSSRATNAESVVQSSPKLPDHCRATLGWHPTIRANPERALKGFRSAFNSLPACRSLIFPRRDQFTRPPSTTAATAVGLDPRSSGADVGWGSISRARSLPAVPLGRLTRPRCPPLLRGGSQRDRSRGRQNAGNRSSLTGSSTILK